MSVHSFRSGVLLSCFLMSTMALAAGPGNYRAHASGADGVDTRAQGEVTLRLNRDEDGLHFRLNVANIEDVTMAHLHLAPAGANGPVVVWLYPAGPPQVLIDGVSMVSSLQA